LNLNGAEPEVAVEGDALTPLAEATIKAVTMTPLSVISDRTLVVCIER
jgi:hypothetical protein